MNKLDYNYTSPDQPTFDPTVFRIQASQISTFFDYTNQFFRQKLLGEEGFKGNTASVLGTCIHYCAEQFIKNGKLSAEDKQEIYDYITEQSQALPDLVNSDEIRTQITPMWSELRNHIQANPVSLAEPFVQVEVLPGITVGGSIDAIRAVDGTVATSIEQLANKQVELIDWKTCGAQSRITDSSMTKAYQWQLLVYAYVLKKLHNINVTKITNVFISRSDINRVSEKTGKPLKDYPSEITPISKPVLPEDLDFIESLIKLVAHSVQSFILNPGPQRALLAQDWRLISHSDPLPFTAVLSSQPEEEI